KKHGQEPIEKALKNPLLAGLLNSAELHPLRDIYSVTLALPNDRDKGLIIVHGKFDPAKLAAVVEALAKLDERVKVVMIDGQTVFVVAPPKGGRYPSEALVAAVDAQTIIVAPDRASLGEALEKHAGKRQPALNKELRKHLEHV